MTDHDFELLSQYLDGELPQPQAQALRQRLLAEPPLRAAYEELKAADSRLRMAFDNEASSAVPHRVSALLAASPRDEAPRRAAWGFAVAATVLLGSGLLLNTAGPQRDEALADVLEQQPSGGEQWYELPGDEAMRPVLTFLATDGHWCREYLLQDAEGAERAVSCRVEGQWQVRISATVTLQGADEGYRAAGASDANGVAEFIDRNAADIPLSASQEQQLIHSAWR